MATRSRKSQTRRNSLSVGFFFCSSVNGVPDEATFRRPPGQNGGGRGALAPLGPSGTRWRAPGETWVAARGGILAELVGVLVRVLPPWVPFPRAWLAEAVHARPNGLTRSFPLCPRPLALPTDKAVRLLPACRGCPGSEAWLLCNTGEAAAAAAAVASDGRTDSSRGRRPRWPCWTSFSARFFPSFRCRLSPCLRLFRLAFLSFPLSPFLPLFHTWNGRKERRERERLGDVCAAREHGKNSGARAHLTPERASAPSSECHKTKSERIVKNSAARTQDCTYKERNSNFYADLRHGEAASCKSGGEAAVHVF